MKLPWLAKYAIRQAHGGSPGSKGDRIVKALEGPLGDAIDKAFDGRLSEAMAKVFELGEQIRLIAEQNTPTEVSVRNG